MSREIIFRGKRVDNGEWVYGSLRLTRYGETYIAFICVDDSINGGTEHSVDYETVGQFINRKDKDDKKIWEFCEINKKYTVSWNFNRYVLTEISTGDIVEIKKGVDYEITSEFVKEYAKIPQNTKGSINEQL